jgi:hypothetical protein
MTMRAVVRPVAAQDRVEGASSFAQDTPLVASCFGEITGKGRDAHVTLGGFAASTAFKNQKAQHKASSCTLLESGRLMLTQELHSARPSAPL